MEVWFNLASAGGWLRTVVNSDEAERVGEPRIMGPTIEANVLLCMQVVP